MDVSIAHDHLFQSVALTGGPERLIEQFPIGTAAVAGFDLIPAEIRTTNPQLRILVGNGSRQTGNRCRFGIEDTIATRVIDIGGEDTKIRGTG